MTLMIIEDEPLLLKTITEKVKKSNHTPLGFSNGNDALTAFDSQKPDVIWLDYYLPDMNGLEFMRKLKAEGKDIPPTIVVSNSSSPEKVSDLLAAGAREYVLKAEHRLEDIIKRAENLSTS